VCHPSSRSERAQGEEGTKRRSRRATGSTACCAVSTGSSHFAEPFRGCSCENPGTPRRKSAIPVLGKPGGMDLARIASRLRPHDTSAVPDAQWSRIARRGKELQRMCTLKFDCAAFGIVRASPPPIRLAPVLLPCRPFGVAQAPFRPARVFRCPCLHLWWCATSVPSVSVCRGAAERGGQGCALPDPGGIRVSGLTFFAPTLHHR